MLFGSESWYGVTKKQLDRLESADLNYFKKLFNASYSTAKEIYHLECAKIPIRFLMISRRLMFWRHIVNTDKEGLLFRFYNLQKQCPVKKDWTVQIEEDKAEIGLVISDENVMNISKRKFKKVLKEKIDSAALKYLNEKAMTHSKSLPLVKNKFICEPYIKDRNFTVEEVQLLFMLRSRQFPVKKNFKNKFKNTNMLCDLCKLEECDEGHATRCAVLKNFVPELNTTPSPDYNDVFGNVHDQLRIVKIFKKIRTQREILFEALSISSF